MYIKEMMICVVVSPLNVVLGVKVDCIPGIFISCRGDSQERWNVVLSFSPLWTGFVDRMVCCFCFKMSGRLHRVALVITLVLPSVHRGLFLCFYLCCSRCRGDTSETLFLNSRSPPYEPNLMIYNGHNFTPFLVTFLGTTFYHGLSAVVWYA